MKLFVGAVLALALAADSATAGTMDGSRCDGTDSNDQHKSSDGSGEFGHFRGVGGMGEWIGFGLGLGFNSYDTGRQQARFQQRFDTLQTQYDNGVSDITDFYTSDTYTGIVDRTQSLVDRYGLFLSSVQHSADRLTDIINIANDDLT